MLIIVAAAGLLVGLLIGVLIGSANENFGEAVWGAVGFVLRPVWPIGLTFHAARRISSFTMRRQSDGRLVRWVTDGNRWIIVYDRPGDRIGPSPLLLLPAGLIRPLVLWLGKPLFAAPEHRPDEGYLVQALRIAPGVTLARRSDQDMAYLEEHGRYRTQASPSAA